MTLTRPQILVQALRSEIEKLRHVRAEIAVSQATFGILSASPSIHDLRGIASVLADLYQGAENAFQRIVKTTGESLPSGHEWHRALLEQISQEVLGVRPAVLRNETRAALDPLRRFRHLARHRYGFDLEWEDIRPLLAAAETTAQALTNDLEVFCGLLDQMADL